MAEPKGPIVVVAAFDPSDDLRALELDADDNLKVAFAAAAQGLVGGHGWISGAWQKNPLLLGLTDEVAGSVTVVSDGSSPTVANGTAVPTGEVWVIEACSAWHDEAANRLTVMYIYKSSSVTSIEMIVNGTAGQYDTLQTLSHLTLFPGDFVFTRCYSLTSGRILRLRYFGRSIDIDQ